MKGGFVYHVNGEGVAGGAEGRCPNYGDAVLWDRFVKSLDGGAARDFCKGCVCDCEAAEDKNRSMNEELKDKITRQLGLDTD